jgi:xanthine dehydrogenase accessory factor
MEDIYQEILKAQKQGDALSLATVVGVKGSTPRAEGSQMLVKKDGTIVGSIGGGCLEATVWEAARSSLKSGLPKIVDYDLTGRTDTPEGLICGGIMKVFVDVIGPKPVFDVFEEIVRTKKEGNVSVLATLVREKGQKAWDETPRILIREDGSALGSLGDSFLDKEAHSAAGEILKSGTSKLLEFQKEGQAVPSMVFVEPITPQPTVYIFGAGHIGFAVSKIAKMTGFRVSVIDDRPAYASEARFPEADEFFVEDPADMVPRLNLNKVSYLVIACRGHLEDQRVLAQAVNTSAGYIGMIGSRKKTKTVFSNLRTEGVTQAALDRIHSPIGLPIATETPEEIAVSIMAEIIDIRRRKNKPETVASPAA